MVVTKFKGLAPSAGRKGGCNECATELDFFGIAEEVRKLAKFQIFKDQAGEYRWRLRADNNEIIADSGEGYVNKSDCRHGIELVKQQAPDAEIEDQT